MWKLVVKTVIQTKKKNFSLSLLLAAGNSINAE